MIQLVSIMSIRRQFSIFLIRWLMNTVGLWVAVRLFGVDAGGEAAGLIVLTFLFAGLIFSVVNSVLRPIMIILSLPVIVLSLGLFTLVVNGVMVYLSLLLAPGVEMSFVDSILAGIILSLVNYIISSALDLREVSHKS